MCGKYKNINYNYYDSDSGLDQQLHSLSSPGELNSKFSQNDKLGQSLTEVMKSRVITTPWSQNMLIIMHMH